MTDFKFPRVRLALSAAKVASHLTRERIRRPVASTSADVPAPLPTSRLSGLARPFVGSPGRGSNRYGSQVRASAPPVALA